jgi:peptidoglycan/xylan/chitin deacetylase (PgdA/CDA1 family)
MIRTLRRRALDAALGLSRLAGLNAVPIFMYHAIHPGDSDLCVSPGAFRDQMAWLHEHAFRTISLDEYRQALTSGTMGRLGRAAVLTFDDGYVNNFELAVPALREHGFSATFFIATGHVGKATGWLDKKWPVMTWEQVRESAQAGIGVGAHTVTHPHLDRIPLSEAREEMARSKAELEERLGRPADWLCYPFGGHTPAVEDAAREIGFHGAVSVAQGNHNAPDDLFRLRRFFVGPATDLRHFALATSRLWTWKHGGGEAFVAS